MMKHFPSPMFFAHRGASFYAPENTLAAFELAYQQGAPAIELDVKLSSDKYAIVIHDQTLERTTNGSGRVTQKSLAELRSLDAGSWKSQGSPVKGDAPPYRGDAPPSAKRPFGVSGEKIPLLEEVFEAVGHKLLINIELTNYATPADGLVDVVAGLIERHGLRDRVMFSSFNFQNLRRAKQLLPDVPCGQLFFPGVLGWHQRLAARFITLEALHPYTSDVNAAWVQQVHASGRRVHTWTVNDAQDMQRLKACAVDAIFTDDPILAQENFL